MQYDFTYLKEALEKMNICLDLSQLNQFALFYEMLMEKNKVMNLTAITEFDAVVEKHFLDSLSLARIISLKEGDTLIDVGTGAGFPGIPLKIAFPDVKITLVDSLNKRVLFLKEVVDALKLTHTDVIHARAEDLAGKADFREQYDYAVSRAVANLSTLSEYCLPFVRVGGKFISYKSVTVDEETASAQHAIALLGGRIQSLEKFEVGENQRAFVVIEKGKNTPRKYPRKAGIPAKEPLK